MRSASRILVAEHEQDTPESLRATLQREGYEVFVSEDGEAALAYAALFGPEVILLDMSMPSMDGWTFVENYRQRPGPHAQIIVLASAADAARNALEVRASGYVPKPLEIGRLLDAIDRCGAAMLEPEL